jgi:hypothetical protein
MLIRRIVAWSLLMALPCVSYAADDWAMRYPTSTALQVITPTTGGNTYLKLDQSMPQTITGLSDGYLKLTSGVIGTDAGGGGSMVYPRCRYRRLHRFGMGNFSDR